jgi:hypothetical protein
MSCCCTCPSLNWPHLCTTVPAQPLNSPHTRPPPNPAHLCTAVADVADHQVLHVGEAAGARGQQQHVAVQRHTFDCLVKAITPGAAYAAHDLAQQDRMGSKG